MTTPGTPRQAPPVPLEGQMKSRAALRLYNTRRHLLPKCGALARSSGEPCRQIAMANGRCYRHGGKTPSGANWHKTQWPDKASPDAMTKLGLKLKKADRAARAKAKRLAAMTPEERAAFDKWQKTHKPGTAAQRAARKLEAQQNAEARARMTTPRPKAPDPIGDALAARIAALEELLRARAAAARGADDQPPDEGIFG